MASYRRVFSIETTLGYPRCRYRFRVAYRLVVACRSIQTKGTASPSGGSIAA